MGFITTSFISTARAIPLRVRSMVGMIPLFAVEVLDGDVIEQLPGFRKRMDWFLNNRKDLARHISYMKPSDSEHNHYLLAVPSQQRLVRVLKYVLNEAEFFRRTEFARCRSFIWIIHIFLRNDGKEYRVQYCPGEGDTDLFGGNSNWRGPVWFPLNFLLLESLEKYHHFYGEGFKVECPDGSGKMLTLQQVADELGTRLITHFPGG